MVPEEKPFSVTIQSSFPLCPLSYYSFLNLPLQETPSTSVVNEAASMAPYNSKEEVVCSDDEGLFFPKEIMAGLHNQDTGVHYDGLCCDLNGNRRPLMTLNQINMPQVKTMELLNSFVKYKAVDGRHIRVYQCSICKYKEISRLTNCIDVMLRFERVWTPVHFGTPPTNSH